MEINNDLKKALNSVRNRIEKIYPINNYNVLKKSIVDLSSGLTEDRKLISTKYLDNEQLKKAYLHYFFYISYAQGFYLIKNLELIDNKIKKQSALDLGCGLGSLSLLLQDWDVREIIGVDYSKEALKTLNNILAAQKTILSDISKKIELNMKFNFITFGHSLNELFKNNDNKIERMVDLVVYYSNYLEDDGYILIIEPATNNINSDFLKFHDLILDKGLYFQYPCIGNYSCPTLQKNGFCHSEYNWEKPEFIQKLLENTTIKKDILNFTGYILKKSNAQSNTRSIYRVISDRMLNKGGKYRYFLCNENGRFTVNMKKDLNSQYSKIFANLKRGYLIDFENSEINDNIITVNENTIIKVINSIL